MKNYTDIGTLSHKYYINSRTINSNLTGYTGTTGAVLYTSGTTYISNDITVQCARRNESILVDNHHQLDNIINDLKEGAYTGLTQFGTISPKDLNYEQLRYLMDEVYNYIESTSTGSTFMLHSFEDNNNVYTDMLHCHWVSNSITPIHVLDKGINEIINRIVPVKQRCYATLKLLQYDFKFGMGAMKYTIKTKGTSKEIFTGIYLR